MKFCMLIMMLLATPLTSAQTLIVGITGDNPPFCSKIDQKNHYFGFDMEIMDSICKRIQAQCKYVPMLFADFFAALDNKKIDLAIDSIIITQERQQNFLFSNPYLTSRIRFLTNLASSIKSPDDIKNKRIGVRHRSQYKELIALLDRNKAEITIYRLMPNLIEALANNKVDAILINNIAAEYWAANNSNQFKLIGSPILLGKGYGIMAKLGQNDLMNKINKALQDMDSDGAYLKIYNNYFDN